ncbi:RING-H2 finger protein ATL66 [Abeliophyllum distichum]|uniref:RING-H2 finger protein ATL66 n=1 Tax=Abeliophyllum distichum TaxID=126358 RepID=A0ABD1VYP6_9LAMI
MSSPTEPFRWHYAEFDDSNFQIRGRTLFFILVLFSIILLVTLLFLYARWVCRHRPPPPPSVSHFVQTPPPPSPPPNPPQQGLDSAAINNLPIVSYRGSGSSSGNFVDSECCICLGIFQDGDEVKVLPRCHHCFHSVCVDKWLTTQSSCPLCRASLRVDSAV